MNAHRKKLILIAAVAGLTSGFTVRWMRRGGSLTGQMATPAASPSSAGGAAHPASTSRPGKKVSRLAADLEQQLSVSSGVSRWLDWMAALEKATLADFPDLARMAKNDPVAFRMIAARWIELNPSHLFDTLMATAFEVYSGTGATAFPYQELAQQLFEEWTQHDPAAVAAALSRPDLPGPLKDLRYSALKSIMKIDPELGLKSMSEWSLENKAARTEGIAKWAAANPQHAAEYALAYPVGSTTLMVMEVIGKAWAKTDPQAALSYASGLTPQHGTALAATVIKEWAAKDLPAVAAWLVSADKSVRRRFNGPMVELWAKTDTAGAMDWIQQNLTGSGLDEAIGSVLRGAAEKNVTLAAELVSGMESSMARTKAAASVAREWFPSYKSSKAPPSDAIAWLSALDPASIRHVMEETQRQWAGADPKGLADFLNTPAGQNAPDYAYSDAAQALARRNPQQALDWASNLQPELRARAVTSVFSEWQSSQPAAAMDWLRQLPSTDPRRESFYMAALNSFFPRGPETAIASKALCAGDTAAAREVIQNLSVPEENKRILIDRLQLK